MKPTIEGKVALVTGGAGGIGERVCDRLAAAGALVQVCDVQGAAGVAERINARHGRPLATAAPCDIAARDKVEALYADIAARHGGVDILINNAAVYGPLQRHGLQEITEEDFLRTLHVDLSGAVYCTLLALDHMKRAGWGRIVFTAAPLSSSAIPAPYLAGKAGFIGLARHIDQRYRAHGIAAFALAVRHVDTPMIRRVIQSRGKDVEQGLAAMNAKSLTGRMITPAEIAELYHDWVARAPLEAGGTVLLADGGITFLR
jgi:NAD(P)-dependent dehydrogenase (short-subunit alcohol dehydrogenase family)